MAKDSFQNSLGMDLIKIERGSFMMGQEDGDFDERPRHRVKLDYSFHMASTVVTNAHYEKFDPTHFNLRGKRGFSREDEEAAVFVSWHDAMKFCRWLSEKEGRPYRLPTEAEWEYACRAGTSTPFHTGNSLEESYYRNQNRNWEPQPVPLEVATTPPNDWGLYDMHGTVEEWCYDWYGRYQSGERINPVGPPSGNMKVTRGGSHNTDPHYLRSANRSGTLPEDKNWLIGFRLVVGELPKTSPRSRRKPLWSTNVESVAHKWSEESEEPVFEGPLRYVNKPSRPENVPFYSHNHCPDISWCDNGDLLAIWFSCEEERGREMTILASRLRKGNDSWDPPAQFFNAPDRNMTGSALFNNGEGKLFHFNGLEVSGCWKNLALVMRTSTDDGASWSHPRLINPNHQTRNQVIAGTIKTKKGYLIQPCDAGAAGGKDAISSIHISRDGGINWTDPGVHESPLNLDRGSKGKSIAGIHAGIEQLSNGDLMAFGRGNNIEGKMPISYSEDMGKTWTYHSSQFPPISSGQRIVFTRLREGPLLLISFTDPSDDLDGDRTGMSLLDATGKERTCYGMFAALSFDEGRHWPIKKLITAGGPSQRLDGGAWTGEFTMNANQSEPMGYLAATQTPDGMIHLISSALYYKFNLAWLLD